MTKSLRTILLLAAAVVLIVPAAQAVPPSVVKQTPMNDVPGEIIAWQDSVFISVTQKHLVETLHRVRRASGNAVAYQVGKTGRGVLVGYDPAGKVFLAQETDSLGVHTLQRGSFPYLQWTPLFAVSDPDPHVSWLPDGKSFLYQDILDDSIGTPCVFHVPAGATAPKLYLFGGQRPLMAPSGDAVAIVSADTLHPGSMREIEQRQPVGIEDLKAGEFRWVAPLRTYVPNHGGWSPDGARLALIGYGSDTTGATERRVYLFTRYTGDTKRIPLPGDRDRPDREHQVDVATWSPDGHWITVGTMSGTVWIVNATDGQATELKSQDGIWRGSPLWIDAHHFVIGEGGHGVAGMTAPEKGKYWVVELAGS